MEQDWFPTPEMVRESEQAQAIYDPKPFQRGEWRDLRNDEDERPEPCPLCGAPGGKACTPGCLECL